MDLASLEAAAEVIRSGGMVAFPTETVYGLGANALDADAVAEVYRIKGRPSANPLIVHVSGIEMARRLVSDWPTAAQRLAERFWPGPLTLVLDRAASVPAVVSAGGPTIALRCPDHPLTLRLIELVGSPLVGPSANPSGTLSPTSADHVRQWLGDRLTVLDGGPCEQGIESTVVSIAGPSATVLRPGVVTPEQLAEVVAVEAYEPITHDGSAGAAAVSPGLLRKHYAPRTPVRLFEPGQRRAVLDRVQAEGSALVVLSPGIRIDHPRVIRMPAQPAAYARELYAALHRADALAAEALLIELPDGDHPIWMAVRDRLRRAAAG